MKTSALLMLLMLISCSKGTEGTKESVSSSHVSSLSQELQLIKKETRDSSHSLSRTELDQLLSEGTITAEEHTELLQLVQK